MLEPMSTRYLRNELPVVAYSWKTGPPVPEVGGHLRPIHVYPVLSASDEVPSAYDWQETGAYTTQSVAVFADSANFFVCSYCFRS